MKKTEFSFPPKGHVGICKNLCDQMQCSPVTNSQFKYKYISKSFILCTDNNSVIYCQSIISKNTSCQLLKTHFAQKIHFCFFFHNTQFRPFHGTTRLRDSSTFYLPLDITELLTVDQLGPFDRDQAATGCDQERGWRRPYPHLFDVICCMLS